MTLQELTETKRIQDAFIERFKATAEERAVNHIFKQTFKNINNNTIVQPKAIARKPYLVKNNILRRLLFLNLEQLIQNLKIIQMMQFIMVFLFIMVMQVNQLKVVIKQLCQTQMLLLIKFQLLRLLIMRLIYIKQE